MNEDQSQLRLQLPDSAWLLSRRQAGDLSLDRLALAAYCGFDAAIHVFGLAEDSPSADNGIWANGLRKWGAETTVRAAIAVARHFAPSWRPGVGAGDLETGLRAVEDRILCPCDAHRQAALERRVSAGGWGWFTPYAETISRRASMKSRRAGLAAELAAMVIEELSTPGSFPNFWAQLWETTLPLPRSKTKEEDAAGTRSAICDQLIPCAIGFRGPVA
jgi:hypothetical protein